MIAEECRIRERFVKERLSRPASHEELKDLTDFFHQTDAELLTCRTCGQLVRHEMERRPEDSYSQESYDPDVMQRQYPRYLNAFRAKERPYRGLLPAGSSVIEIGSHYGAFLEAATEWGWQIEGVDIGKDTSHFARGKGFVIHQCELADCKFESASRNGVFIWNCFEQIEDPALLLAECKRILKSAGMLVLRTPNGLFYRTCRELLDSGTLEHDAAGFLIDALGYNNLLGFPYLYGYSADRLARCASAAGFRLEGMLNSQLITLPLPDDPDWVEKQERLINTEVKLLARSLLEQRGTLIGPWIEVWFRCN